MNRVEYYPAITDPKYVSASPKEYPQAKQIQVEREGTVYTRKGKSFAPISFLDRVISGLFAAFLTLCLIPVLFPSGRKYIKQLAKEAWRQKGKVDHYVGTKVPQVSLANRICESGIDGEGLKDRLKEIESIMQSACCFVEITVGGAKTIRQYVFENKDGSLLDKNAIHQRIDRINKDLAKITSASKNFSYSWAVLAKVEDEKTKAEGKEQFFCIGYHANEETKKNASGENALTSHAGGSSGDWGIAALYQFSQFCKDLKIDVPYKDKKFVKSPYYQEIN